jgi:hypothetical protein
MSAADGLDALFEEDDIVSVDDLLRDAPPGCLFCRLGDLGEGEDD